MKLTYSCCLYFLPQIVGTIVVTSPDLEGGSMCAETFKQVKVSPPTYRRRSGPAASALDLRIERSRLEHSPGHCVLFLGKTVNSAHSTSLHPGV